MKIIRYVILFGLMAICFGLLGAAFYFDSYFYVHSPKEPDQLHGYVYPAIVHHGAKVYLSAEQWRWFESTDAKTCYSLLFLAAATGAYLLNQRWKLLRNNSEPSA
jgi:hypothetical protein